MITITPQPTPNCDEVQREVGNDFDLMQEFPEISREIADNAVDSSVIPYYSDTSQLPSEVAVSIEKGRRSEKALLDLGCAACSASGECRVNEILETNIETSNYVQRLDTTITMLLESPIWLQKARAAIIDVDVSTDDGKQIIKSLLERAEDPGSGALQELSDLVAGYESTPIQSITKSDSSELARVDNLKTDKPIPGHRIKTPNGKIFDVFDATEAVDFQGTVLTNEEQQNLGAKLLKRLAETNGQGKSQILIPDGSQQTNISGWRKNGNEGMLCEIRMGGKARLYITVPEHVEEGVIPRLIILGSHGDKAEMQDKFFGHIGF